MKMFNSIDLAIAAAIQSVKHRARLVHTEKWQGVDIAGKPEMATYELLNYSFTSLLDGTALPYYQAAIKPNLPWADDHFLERVCGYPLNPGLEWANWPYGKSAARFLDDNGQFNHSYAERYWPRFAHEALPSEVAPSGLEYFGNQPMKGIREIYGDLRDVVYQLKFEPLTRQAYLPIFFPEDTGGVRSGRVPCSLGYHFIMREGYLHIVYWLRSCDLVRHFRDDIYLTIRLLLWVLDELRKEDPETWSSVQPGTYTMHITSLHIFKGDYQPLFGESK